MEEIYAGPDLTHSLDVPGSVRDEGVTPGDLDRPRTQGRSHRRSVCLVLGDNIFYGQGLAAVLQRCAGLDQGGVVFGYKVRDPERYGVLELVANHSVISIE